MQQPSSHRHHAEQLLEALTGVVSAHIVTGTAGRPEEIHVLATPRLHPKQVVRNVESALSAGLGIEVDRRIISVAQLRADTNGDPEDPTPAEPAKGTQPEPTPGAGRLEYVRYQSHRGGERCTCEVTVRTGDDEVSGSGSGPDSVVGRTEAAAEAVLNAVMQARAGVELRLEGAAVVPARGQRFVLVSAHGIVDRTTLRLSGAARLTRSPEEAAILAALQATNRWSD